MGALTRLSLLLAASGAKAFVYEGVHMRVGTPGSAGSPGVSGGDDQYVNVLSEGPMFATDAGPFDVKGSSYISAFGVASASDATGPSGTPVAQAVRLHTVHVDTETQAALSGRSSMGGLGNVGVCCTPDGVATGTCARVGDLLLRPLVSGIVPDLRSYDIAVGETAMLNTSFSVVREGLQYFTFVACAVSDAPAVLPALSIDVDLTFRNPYGFLPGMSYGYLPFTGILFVMYTLLAIAYGVALIVQRRYLLRLQYLVFGTMAFGMLEMAVWFFTWENKNRTGSPTPCDLCPTTPDFVTAVVLTVFKRTTSRILLLAVALGFGIVHSTLSRRAVAFIGGLGLTYLIFGILDEVSRQTSYDREPSVMELPVLAANLGFLMGIYMGFNKVRADLNTSGQLAKLQMYTQLYWVLLVTIAVWFIVTAVVQLIRFGLLPLSWQSLFFLLSFDDVTYLLVLAAIGWIWMPGPVAFQYAWYSQPAGTEGEADADESAAAGGRSSGAGEVELAVVSAPRHAFTIAIDDDDDDGNTVAASSMSAEASDSTVGPHRVDASSMPQNTTRAATLASSPVRSPPRLSHAPMPVRKPESTTQSSGAAKPADAPDDFEPDFDGNAGK